MKVLVVGQSANNLRRMFINITNYLIGGVGIDCDSLMIRQKFDNNRDPEQYENAPTTNN